MYVAHSKKILTCVSGTTDGQNIELWDVAGKYKIKSHTIPIDTPLVLWNFFGNDKLDFVTSNSLTMEWPIDKTSKPTLFQETEKKGDDIGPKAVISPFLPRQKKKTYGSHPRRHRCLTRRGWGVQFRKCFDGRDCYCELWPLRWVVPNDQKKTSTRLFFVSVFAQFITGETHMDE